MTPVNGHAQENGPSVPGSPLATQAAAASRLSETGKGIGGGLGSNRMAGDERHERSAAGTGPGTPVCRPAGVHGPFERAVYSGRVDAQIHDSYQREFRTQLRPEDRCKGAGDM